MVKIEDVDALYRELRVLDSDEYKHTCDCLEIRDDNELINAIISK